MTQARRIRVAGRVQGVFFRAWTRQQARELGVAGWVRNCPDGSVEAHVEGEDSAVGQMIERMRAGPPAAEVEGIASDDVEPEGMTGFAIRR